jgi:23S rRNA (cytosine1962-C5)-methyltransferase
MESVHVNKRSAARVDTGHPWIFRSDVLETGGATAGETVRVVCGSRDLGAAHYSASSQIALRMLSKRVEPVDLAFFTQKLQSAIAFRKQVVTGSDAYRLVYAEADGLPALIIDRYADYLVLQALNQGMDRATATVTEALETLLHPAGILARNDAASRTQEELPREVRVLRGSIPDSIAIQMNGLRFHADLQHGMKTGIFLDQRENYVAAARHARGTALDCFTSTGGFALHLAAKCESVEAVDSSETAIAAAQSNAHANGIGNVNFREADVFEALAGYAAARRKFDTLVLDPPAYAKSRSHLEAARRAYKEINRRALQLLVPGGVLVTCSCSHHMSEADLLEVIAEAALETKRTLRVLERRTQASDHPVLLAVPETLYLKCLIVQDTRTPA